MRLLQQWGAVVAASSVRLLRLILVLPNCCCSLLCGGLPGSGRMAPVQPVSGPVQVWPGTMPPVPVRPWLVSLQALLLLLPSLLRLLLLLPPLLLLLLLLCYACLAVLHVPGILWAARSSQPGALRRRWSRCKCL